MPIYYALFENHQNKPGQLVFLNPPGLPLDTFHIEVRARVRGGEQLRT